MESHFLEVFADYHQLLLHDEKDDGDHSELWNDESSKQMVVVSDSAVTMLTARDMNVPVEVVIADNEPSYVVDEWDHIVKCSLKLYSGSLVVRGVSDYLPNAKKIVVAPGQYTVWLLYGGLNTLDEGGLEGEDRYKVVLFRSEFIAKLVILKKGKRGRCKPTPI